MYLDVQLKEFFSPVLEIEPRALYSATPYL